MTDVPALTTSWLPADTSIDLIEHAVPELLANRAATHPDRLALVVLGQEFGDTPGGWLT